MAENSLSLTIITFLNYGFPLFLIPYLTQVLGAEEYGIYAFTLAIANYFALFVKFGFEFSATKQLAQIRDDKSAVNALFSRVMTIRVLLMFVSVVVLALLIFFIPKLYEIRHLLILAIGVFVGMGLVPIWFFQGIENMKFITMVNFFTRMCSTLLIVFFVKSPSDTVMAVGFQAVGFVLGGVLALILVFVKFRLHYAIPRWSSILEQMRAGWHLFLSNVGVNFYRESNVLILGALTDYTIVGYYAAAEKIVKAVQSLLLPVVQALFPFFGRRLSHEIGAESNLRTFIKLGKIYAAVLSCCALLMIVLSPMGVRLVLGPEYYNSITNIQILSGVIVFGGLNYYFGIVGLVNLGYEKQFTRRVWFSGILSVLLCILFVSFFQDLGAAIVMTLAEGILFVLVISFFRHHMLRESC